MVANRNIKAINLFAVCCNAVFFLPVVVPYYNSIGLTFRDFLIGEAVFSAMILLSEIPSGWLSDVWRRKSTLMLGMFFGILGYFWLLISKTLIDTIIAQGIIGIAVALFSGTNSALLYDSLLQDNRESEFHRLQGKSHAYGLYATASACLIGGFVFTIDPKLPILLSIAMMIIGMIGIAFAFEPQRAMKAPEKNIFRDMLSTMHYALRGHPEIAGIIFVSMGVFCASKMMLWAQQPYFSAMGFPVVFFGIIMAINQGIGGLASHWSHKIEPYGSNRDKLKWLVIGLGLSCLALWAFPSPFLCLPLFVMGAITYGGGFPAVQNAINRQVSSERRATILSTASLMVHIVTIPTSLMLGAIQESSDIMTALAYLGMQVLIIGGVGLWLWKPKDPIPA